MKVIFRSAKLVTQSKAVGAPFIALTLKAKVFEVRHGTTTLIKSGFKASADIGLTSDEKYLLVPDMKAGELVWLPIKQ